MIRRVLKLLISLVAAGSVLTLGAAAGGAFAAPHPSAPRAAPEQRYQGATAEIAVGDALRVNGQPMQLSIFFTQDAPARVVSFYAAAFRARGLVPVLGPGHVSAFDPHDGWQRFVSALSQTDGETLVMTGTGDARRPPSFLHAAERAGFPVPPQSRGFLGYASRDGGLGAETAQFASPLAPAEVASFYRQRLVATGWQERAPAAVAGSIAFARGGETLSVSLEALSSDKGTAVFVTRIQGGAP